MDIMGSFPVASTDKRFVLGITKRFSKLTRMIPIKRVTAAHIAEIVSDACTIPCCMPK